MLKEVQEIFDSMVLDPELLKDVISYIKQTSNSEKEYHNLRVKDLRTEDTKIKNRMDRLTELYLDGDIDKKEYEENRKNFIKRRHEIVREFEQHINADDKFQECLINLVELAHGAGKAFRGSTTSEKRELINLVFANLPLNGHTLEFKLRPPFDGFIKCTKIEEWRTREESNP